MSKSFKGFNPEGDRDSETSARLDTYLSELSEYESQESRETSPTNSQPSSSAGAASKKEQSGKVRRLVEHFSHSDSDSSETTNTSLRSRKKSKSSEHQELPPGGERQLRRIMARQETANNALRVYEALIEDLKTSLDEAQSALDQNKPRPVLLGELEGLLELSETAWDRYENLVALEGSEGVALNFVEIKIKKNKLKARSRKTVGHLRAATEVTVTPNSTVQIMNPMSFGDLKLPEFSGDFTEFEPFEGNFRKLIENGNLDDGCKKAYLLRCLTGEAKSYIGTDGTAAKTYEEIWGELKQRYGKPWRVTRAAIKKMMDIPDPRNDSKDIMRYWNEISEVCKTAERLKLTASSIILNMALLKLPSEYRAKMDDKLKPLSQNYVLTRQMVAEPFNDVIAIEMEKPNNIISTLGFNTSVGTATANKNNKSNFSTKSYKKKGRTYFCMLCNKGGTDHLASTCNIYTKGEQARARLVQLGRCTRCATLREEHGPMCSHRAICSVHPNQRHHYWLCGGDGNRGSGRHLGNNTPQQNGQEYDEQGNPIA